MVAESGPRHALRIRRALSHCAAVSRGADSATGGASLGGCCAAGASNRERAPQRRSVLL